MSDEIEEDEHHTDPVGQKPPDGDTERPGESLMGTFLDLFDTVTGEIEKNRKPDPTRRPKEVWIRWKVSPVGPNAIELIGCTEKPLDAALGEGEHEGRFR